MSAKTDEFSRFMLLSLGFTRAYRCNILVHPLSDAEGCSTRAPMVPGGDLSSEGFRALRSTERVKLSQKSSTRLYQIPHVLTQLWDSRGGGYVIQHGEHRRLTMARAITLRSDFTASDLRRLARLSKDAPQARRLLALAAL